MQDMQCIGGGGDILSIPSVPISSMYMVRMVEMESMVSPHLPMHDGVEECRDLPFHIPRYPPLGCPPTHPFQRVLFGVWDVRGM